MRNFYLIFSLFVILTMWACDTECKNHFINPYTTSTTISEPHYDMDEANAEIVKRYDAKSGHFANCQNGKIYVVSQQFIKIFDVTGDAITYQNQIEMKKSDLDNKWNFWRCYGIADLGEKYLLLMRLDNTNDSIKTLVSIKHDGTEFGLSDLTTDLLPHKTLQSIYYNSKDHLLSVMDSESIMALYNYDPTNDKLDFKDYFGRYAEDYLTKTYCYDNHYYLDDTQILCSWCNIYIRKIADTDVYCNIYPYYLGLSKPVLSVFDNDGDVYLFYKDDDDYKFMRINAGFRRYIYDYYED